MNEWCVYLLKCADETLYCGVTKDIKNRLKTHNEGKGAKYTRGRLPVTLVCFVEGLTKSDAYSMEYKVKRLPKYKKAEYLHKAAR